MKEGDEREGRGWQNEEGERKVEKRGGYGENGMKDKVNRKGREN